MIRAGRTPALLLVLAALSLVAAGCGDDDGDDEISIPTISVPDTTEPEPATTEAPPTTTEPPSGGGSGESGQPEDSATNDIPPPPGSPQEAFEQFCEQNPGAC